jgi:hypothetical protein
VRLAFDLDGVLADLDGALSREAQRLFGVEPGVRTPLEGPAVEEESEREAETDIDVPPPVLSLTSRQTRTLWNEVRSIKNFWETLDEIEAGSIRRLAALVKARRWELLFITSRPDAIGDSVQLQSQRWLEARGFALPSVFVVHGSRGRIATALHLDLVVDDRPENCLDVVLESKARAILVWRGEAGAVPASARRLGIGGVQSVSAVLDVLERADAPEEGGGGMMERVKRLLGLKSAAETETTLAR